ncbi:radical SAM/SPASM domain-containing protein [Odoribacter laneus]|jgi:radical SAM domain protein|uniref:Radical SAM additional 4Fe4S-binding domain-containing protein n=1 Tax=Odoribacter laneus YIT 12061 TaxID=742817 RepID=H1DGC6_9BACT|nr:radical SAM protein [Odoribacter laneus]EHP48114.1 radical SAM additional 4Fe4S-binding domain-containing protein [Odoribacter laneus YIT 12061]
MRQMQDGKLVIKKYPAEHYSTLFNKKTGLFVRIEDKGFPEPFWAKSGPELIDISITNYCSKGCIFCYRNSSIQGKHMIFEDYVDVIQQAQNIGVLQVALGGGNPNQHPNFIEILKETVSHGIVPSYTSNGIGLTSNILKATKEFCGALAISAYEPYESLEDLILFISQYKIKINIHFMLDKFTIEKAISWLKNPPSFFKYINAIIFLNYKPVNSSHDFLLKKSLLLPLFFEQVQCNKSNIKIGFDSCSISGILKYMDVSNIFYESCEAARFSAFISEDMKMYPCSFMVNTNEYGDLKRNSIREIWQNDVTFIKHREKILKNRCFSCKYEQKCKGGCQFLDCINLC